MGSGLPVRGTPDFLAHTICHSLVSPSGCPSQVPKVRPGGGEGPVAGVPHCPVERRTVTRHSPNRPLQDALMILLSARAVRFSRQGVVTAYVSRRGGGFDWQEVGLVDECREMVRLAQQDGRLPNPPALPKAAG